jgi:hypothetical protein
MKSSSAQTKEETNGESMSRKIKRFIIMAAELS